jgi:fructosamine-3-kinase
MTATTLQNRITTVIQEAFNIPILILDFLMIGGGSINKTYQITTNKKEKFFCKINSASRFPGMFEKEKRGLELLGAEKIIRVPNVLAAFEINDDQVLILEWIEQGIKSDRFWKKLGEQLAALHMIPRSECGLRENNYMGALPQVNDRSSNWVDFFIHQRLMPQVNIAFEKKFLHTKHLHQFEKLYTALPEIFPPENFSLLHGDLWSGNFLCDHSGIPVLIDPAVYNGHRSMDLGMTTLFGGFDPLFYDTYNRVFPFPPNYHKQWEICNVYPLLIHLNLFGKGYLQNIISVIQDY